MEHSAVQDGETGRRDDYLDGLAQAVAALVRRRADAGPPNPAGSGALDDAHPDAMVDAHPVDRCFRDGDVEKLAGREQDGREQGGLQLAALAAEALLVALCTPDAARFGAQSCAVQVLAADEPRELLAQQAVELERVSLEAQGLLRASVLKSPAKVVRQLLARSALPVARS